METRKKENEENDNEHKACEVVEEANNGQVDKLFTLIID